MGTSVSLRQKLMHHLCHLLCIGQQEQVAALNDRERRVGDLEQLLTSISAVGTALIWPCRDRTVLWKVYYAGIQRTAMQRWLSMRLTPSLDATIGVLQHDLTHSLEEMPPPLLMRLCSLPSSPCAAWILWIAPRTEPSLPGAVGEYIERVRQTLEAVLEVEEREAHFFTSSSPLYDRDLIEALVHDDPHALSTFLSLTRVVAAADFAFWGRAYQDVVEVTGHRGAKQSEFSFALRRGHGVGGRVIAYGEPIALPDYRNSPYRHSSVSDIVDAEEIRAGMAVPVRATTVPEQPGPVTAVLYATRRTVTPFSLTERLLVQRQADLLGHSRSRCGCAPHRSSYQVFSNSPITNQNGTSLSCTPIALRPWKRGPDGSSKVQSSSQMMSSVHTCWPTAKS